MMNNNFLLSMVCLITICSCKKDDVNNPAPIPTQARTADVFGHPLSTTTPCLKKMYFDDVNIAIYFNYDANGLVTSAVARDGAVEMDRMNFYYDAMHKLVKVDGDRIFLLQYGADNKVIKMIVDDTDTLHFSYPSAGLVVANIFSGGGGMVDTLRFDNNFNLVSFSSWYEFPGFPSYFNSGSTISRHISAKSPFYNSALSDFYMLQDLISGYLDSEYTGPNLISLISYTDGMYTSELTLLDSQVNSNNYPTYVKYRYTYDVNSEIYETRYEYLCE